MPPHCLCVCVCEFIYVCVCACQLGARGWLGSQFGIGIEHFSAICLELSTPFPVLARPYSLLTLALS